MQIQFILLHERLTDGSTPADFPGKPPKLFETETAVKAAIERLPKSHDWVVYKVVNGKARVCSYFNKYAGEGCNPLW